MCVCVVASSEWQRILHRNRAQLCHNYRKTTMKITTNFGMFSILWGTRCRRKKRKDLPISVVNAWSTGTCKHDEEVEVFAFVGRGQGPASLVQYIRFLRQCSYGSGGAIHILVEIWHPLVSLGHMYVYDAHSSTRRII